MDGFVKPGFHPLAGTRVGPRAERTPRRPFRAPKVAEAPTPRRAPVSVEVEAAPKPKPKARRGR